MRPDGGGAEHFDVLKSVSEIQAHGGEFRELDKRLAAVLRALSSRKVEGRLTEEGGDL